MRETTIGPGRVLLFGYALFVVAAGGRSIEQLATHASRAPLAYGLSAFAASMYLVGAVSIAVGARTRAVFVVELIGVGSVGVASYLVPGAFPDATVWSHFGSGYGFVPAALPVLALWWIAHENKLERLQPVT